MARTTLVKTIAPGAYDDAGAEVVMAAADTVDKNQFLCSGKDLVVAFNSGANPRTVTIDSTDDERGRQEDITAEAIAAGTVRIFGPFEPMGWRQVGTGYIYLEASDADVLLGVIQLP